MSIWKYKLDAGGYVYDLPKEWQNKGIKKCYDDNKKWATITNTQIIVEGEYAWDGCSPKYKMFGKIVGTPDFPETYEASLVHDVLCQFFNIYHPNFLYTQKEIDKLFYHIMKVHNFKYAKLYYTAVRGYSILSGKG